MPDPAMLPGTPEHEPTHDSKAVKQSSSATRGLARAIARRSAEGASLFWAEPALVSLRLIAAALAGFAVVGVIANLVSANSRFAMDPFTALGLVFVAWMLSSKNVSRRIIGAFLGVTFLFSIVLLILPVEQIVGTLNKSMEEHQKSVQQLAGPVAMNITALERDFSTLAIQHREIADDPAAGAFEDHLAKARKALPLEEDLSDIVYRQLWETASYLLTKSAPFFYSMLMGLMGSAIAVSRQFVTRFDERPPIWYVYRLLQGMIIALLIVYGLVAGMLSLGASSGNQPIDIAKFDTNKYFIGFVSALAGLFSEHAFSKLESVSANVFGRAPRNREDDQAEVAGATPASQESAAGRKEEAEPGGST